MKEEFLSLKMMITYHRGSFQLLKTGMFMFLWIRVAYDRHAHFKAENVGFQGQSIKFCL